MKKAQVTIDMVVAMMIFVSMIAGAFYYMFYLANPKQPFDVTLRDQGFLLSQKLGENVSWTVYRAPVWIDSDASAPWNFELLFVPDVAVDQNSIAILDANLSEIPSAFSQNYTVWVSNITSGRNTFYLSYTKNTTLSLRSHSTDLASSGLSANNSEINVTFTSSGISSLLLDGSEMLGNGIDLGTSGTPSAAANFVRAKFSYPDGVYASVYQNLSKIKITSNHSINPVIYLKPGLANYYNGTAYSFSASGQMFNSIRNSTDIYSASGGVSVIGRNMNVSIYNTTYREIRLYNVTEFEIFAHSGNYVQALDEEALYLGVQPTILGIPRGLRGVSVENLDSLAGVAYADVKARFGGTSNFNLTIENTSASVGKKIPEDISVVIVKAPVAVVGRLGNITETYFSVAVWMGGVI